MKTTTLLVLALTLSGLSACGSIGDLVADHDVAFDTPGPHVYGGVRLMAVYSDPGYWGGHMAPVAFVAWLDMPLSAALDTVLLLFTVPYSLAVEGRDDVTVDRAGLDAVLLEREREKSPGRLLYMGSEGGYHHLMLYCDGHPGSRYRIRERELSMDTSFPYTRKQEQWIVVKYAQDPWPQPEPLKNRFTEGQKQFKKP